MMPTTGFQTRSEETGLASFHTLKEATTHAFNDRTVWKISFSLMTGERVRLVWREGDWVLEQIEIPYHDEVVAPRHPA